MSDGASVGPLAPAEWDASLSHILEEMRGAPLNVHSLMANNPALLKAWWSFRNHSVGGGTLGRRRGELVILRTALQMRAWYEWASHVERAQAAGLSLDEIERVKQGGKAAQWSIEEALLLAAVDELMENHGLSPESRSKLAKHFSVAEIMDIMAINGMYVILGSMINTWGLALDASVAAKLPGSLSKEAFEAEFPR